MSDVHIWNVGVAGDVIGDIIESDSTFYTGPFDPGQENANVMLLYYMNTGSMDGTIHCKWCEYPNTPNESCIDVETTLPPGTSHTWNLFRDVPNTPGEIWPMGVKVWGETESEPNWTGAATGKLEIPPGIIAVGALVGVFGLAYLFTKK